MTRAETAIQAATEKNMTATLWSNETETRVYLRRTNAARTEAGYIAIWKRDGKWFSQLRGCPTGGAGSRTATSEAESVYARYKELRAANAKNI